MNRLLQVLLLLLMLLLASAARAQLTIPNGSTLTVSSGTTISIVGAVQNDGTLANAGTVQLTGTLASPGAVTGSTGLMQLTGTTAQVLGVSSLLPSLEIINPQGAVQAAPLRVRQLLLTAGPLRLGAYDFTSTVGGSIGGINAAAGRFLITDGTGALQQYVGTSAQLFPVGPTVTRYAPATLTRSTGSDLYALRVAPDVLNSGSTGAPRLNHAVALHWELTSPDAVPFAMPVQWQPTDELPAFDRTQAALARWSGAAYAPAGAFGPAVGAGSYTLAATSLTSAGPYVVLDQQAPLPVQLTRFEAWWAPAPAARVELRWETAQELNSAGFEVQRQDEGQTGFRRVGYVAARGTSSLATYSFSDPNNFAGLSYYRLRQLDLDGTESYSAVQVVAGLSAGPVFSLSALPNPVQAGGSLTLEAAGPVPAGLRLVLYAADGRRLWEMEWPNSLDARLLLPLVGLPQGTYWLHFETPRGPRGTLPIVVAD